jgi:hypothetical protein
MRKTSVKGATLASYSTMSGIPEMMNSFTLSYQNSFVFLNGIITNLFGSLPVLYDNFFGSFNTLFQSLGMGAVPAAGGAVPTLGGATTNALQYGQQFYY